MPSVRIVIGSKVGLESTVNIVETPNRDRRDVCTLVAGFEMKMEVPDETLVRGSI
jgi:hypothetical protein